MGHNRLRVVHNAQGREIQGEYVHNGGLTCTRRAGKHQVVIHRLSCPATAAGALALDGDGGNHAPHLILDILHADLGIEQLVGTNPVGLAHVLLLLSLLQLRVRFSVWIPEVGALRNRVGRGGRKPHGGIGKRCGKPRVRVLAHCRGNQRRGLGR